jgi:transmembrane sensor
MENEFVWNLIAKKLSGEASPEELQDLENQLRANPELHYSMQTIIDLWKPGPSLDLEEAHKAFNWHISRMEELGINFPSQHLQTDTSNIDAYEFPGNKRKKNLLWLVPSLLIVTGLLFWGFYSSNSSFVNNTSVKYAAQPLEKTISEISTRNGSKTNVVLPDGTQVWLNAGSKLTYDKNYGNNIREVNLAGEAFFDVVHNAEKPFIIHAASISIKVLGTKFNVKSYPADKTTEATLIRGSIEVSFKNRPNEKIILKPSEKIIVSNLDNSIIRPIDAKIEQRFHVHEPIVAVSNLTYYQHSNDVVETSWVENKLIFQDESFEDLARQLERWYGVVINFKNPEMEQLYFTGNFKNESITQALNALKLSNNFTYTIAGNNITILK